MSLLLSVMCGFPMAVLHKGPGKRQQFFRKLANGNISFFFSFPSIYIMLLQAAVTLAFVFI